MSENIDNKQLLLFQEIYCFQVLISLFTRTFNYYYFYNAPFPFPFPFPLPFQSSLEITIHPDLDTFLRFELHRQPRQQLQDLLRKAWS